MKGRVIRYTRSNFLIPVLHSYIIWGGSPSSRTSFLKKVGHSVI